MEFMATIPDKYYELAIVDPPYMNTYKSMKTLNSNMKGKKAKVGKYHYSGLQNSKPNKEYFIELMRVSKNQIIWGGNYFTDNLFESRCWVVWDKETQESKFADIEMAWTSFDKNSLLFKYCWNGMLQGDMKNKEIRIHATQKPVASYRFLLNNFTKQGDKILDTHGGSMSIAVACADMGFDLDLCELDETHYKDGVDRVKNHLKQVRMFGEPIDLILK